MNHFTRLHRTIRALPKLAFGIGVFATTVGGWSYIGPSIVKRLPLPDSIADDRESDCALWFIGSSSIAKWTSLDREFPRWQAHRRGIDGAMLDQIEARALRTDSMVAPAGLVFYAGENDIASGASGVEAARMMERLVRAMEAKWPASPIFIVSLKPSPERWAQRPEQLRYNQMIARFVVGRRDVTLIQAGSALLRNGAPNPGLYVDNVHLNAAGYAMWSRDIRQGIERAMPARRSAACPTPIVTKS